MTQFGRLSEKGKEENPKEISKLETIENASLNKDNKLNTSNKVKANIKLSVEIVITIDFILYLVTSYYSAWHAEVHNKIMNSGTFYNKPNFGDKYKYLTIIGDHLTPLFFLLSVVKNTLYLMSLIMTENDTTFSFQSYVPLDFNWKLSVDKILMKYEAFMDCFNIFLTSINTMIAILFWTIYYLNKENILPKKVEKLYPLQLNLFIHGMTGLIMWCHNLICIRYKIYDLKYHRLIMIMFVVTYCLWVIICYIINGWWAYDFLNYMSYFQHFLLMCIVTISCMLANEIVCYIISYLHLQKIKVWQLV